MYDGGMQSLAPRTNDVGQHSNLKVVVGVGAIYMLSIPIVFLFLAAGGMVQSDVGHSVPHLQIMMRLEKHFALVLFLSGSSAWAFSTNSGLRKTAWIILLLPSVSFSSIILEQIAYNIHVKQCVQTLGTDQSQGSLERYCEDSSMGIFAGSMNHWL